jgi:hypothetical protein
MLQQDKLNSMISENDIVFIISSIGGGTGSGMAPITCDILSRKYPEKRFILIEVYPPIGESLAAQQNSLDYLKEVNNNMPNVCYIAYDNNKYTDLTTPEMMQKVNNEIVDMLPVFRGDYFYSTPFNSIDDKDLLSIVGTPGRMAVYILDNIKEKDFDNKSIEDAMIDIIKNKSANVELDRDKIVKKIGIVTNLNTKLNKLIDPNYSKIQELVGTPIELFEHVYMTSSDNETNRMILILAGLSVPDDRLTKMVQRIESGLEELAHTKESSVLGNTDTVSMVKDLRSNNMQQSSEFSLEELFG